MNKNERDRKNEGEMAERSRGKLPRLSVSDDERAVVAVVIKCQQ